MTTHDHSPRVIGGVPLATMPILQADKAKEIGSWGKAPPVKTEKAMGNRTYSENAWDEVEEDKWADHDIALAVRIGDALTSHYPGHPWFVEVDSNGGLAMISIPAITGRFAYVLKLRLLGSDPSLKSVIRAGGEILERWKIPRSRLDAAAFNAALKRVPKNGVKGRIPV
jgi:hypothetical protein